MVKELSQNGRFLEVPYRTLEFQRCSRALKSGQSQTKKKKIHFFWRTFKLEQNLLVFMTFETFGEVQGGLYPDHSKHLFLILIE